MDAELGRDHTLIPSATGRESNAECPFSLARAPIRLGAIKEVNACILCVRVQMNAQSNVRREQT